MIFLGLFTPHPIVSTKATQPPFLCSYPSLQTYFVRRLRGRWIEREGTEMLNFRVEKSNFRIEEQFIFPSVFAPNCVPLSESHYSTHWRLFIPLNQMRCSLQSSFLPPTGQNDRILARAITRTGDKGASQLPLGGDKRPRSLEDGTGKGPYIVI